MLRDALNTYPDSLQLADATGRCSYASRARKKKRRGARSGSGAHASRRPRTTDSLIAPIHLCKRKDGATIAGRAAFCPVRMIGIARSRTDSRATGCRPRGGTALQSALTKVPSSRAQRLAAACFRSANRPCTSAPRISAIHFDALKSSMACLDVVGQVALGLAQVVDLGRGAVDAGLEDRVERQVRIRIRRDRANFDAHRARVADGHAHHGAAIGGRSLDLVRRFKVRIETAIGIHAGVQDEADIERVGQDAIDELPAEARRAAPGPSHPRTGWSCPSRSRRWCACRCR